MKDKRELTGFLYAKIFLSKGLDKIHAGEILNWLVEFEEIKEKEMDSVVERK